MNFSNRICWKTLHDIWLIWLCALGQEFARLNLLAFAMYHKFFVSMNPIQLNGNEQCRTRVLLHANILRGFNILSQYIIIFYSSSIFNFRWLLSIIHNKFSIKNLSFCILIVEFGFTALMAQSVERWTLTWEARVHLPAATFWVVVLSKPFMYKTLRYTQQMDYEWIADLMSEEGNHTKNCETLVQFPVHWHSSCRAGSDP